MTAAKLQKLLALAGLAFVLSSGAVLSIGAQRLFNVYDANYDFLLSRPPYAFGVVSPELFQYRDKVQGVVESVQGQERCFKHSLLLSCFLLLAGVAIAACGFILRRRIRTVAA